MKLSQGFVFTNRIGFVEKLLFTKHLSVMLKSGIALSDSIEALRDQTQSPALKPILTSMLNQVLNGKSLEQAISAHPNVFDPFYRGLVRVGEESGTLDINLTYLASKLHEEREFRKKIQGALMYPALVLGASTIIGLGVSYFLLPQLSRLFESLDVELPLSTKILLLFSDIVKRFGPLIPVAAIAGFIGGKAFVAHPKIKPYWHAVLLRLPVLGPFFCMVELASLFRNIGIMLKSGLPLTTVLEIQAQSTSNLVFQSYIRSMLADVEHGKTIEGALASKHYPLIPKIAGKMIGVGEKSGNLEESCTYLGDFFAEEVDGVAKNFSTLLEPVMLIVIGLIVAFMGFSIITPLYQLTSGIRR